MVQTEIDSKLSSFETNHKVRVGYPAGSYVGECLSLVKYWVDVVAGKTVAPSAGGFGDYYYSKFPAPLSTYFTKVNYVPGQNYPAGSLVAYAATHHLAIWKRDNGNGTHTVFEQNADPDGSAPHEGTRSNSRVTGILVIKVTAPTPAPGLDMPAIGSRIQLVPKDNRTTYKAGTADVAGHIPVIDDTFIYVVRGYDSKYPGRILINSASGGGNGVGLALYYVGGARIPGWKKI